MAQFIARVDSVVKDRFRLHRPHPVLPATALQAIYALN